MNEPATAAADETAEHRLILASRVLKTPVFNAAGERIGHVDDLSIERATGKAEYAIVSFGGFLGIGERFHPLPWATLHYDQAQGGFVVPLDRAALADAPSYDAVELRKLGGEDHQAYSEAILTYYARYGGIGYI